MIKESKYHFSQSFESCFLDDAKFKTPGMSDFLTTCCLNTI
ncbi:hypothetical protein V3C99_012645 [Haemonchus contortus]|uniref:Transposase n=1 Tax=Haemonchus contortus TaxID=6289 RepID=A0A7I4Y1T1_HAECO